MSGTDKVKNAGEAAKGNLEQAGEKVKDAVR
jgi:hypothetical protein